MKALKRNEGFLIIDWFKPHECEPFFALYEYKSGILPDKFIDFDINEAKVLREELSSFIEMYDKKNEDKTYFNHPDEVYAREYMERAKAREK